MESSLLIIGAYQGVGAMVCCFSSNYITYLRFKKAKKNKSSFIFGRFFGYCALSK